MNMALPISYNVFELPSPQFGATGNYLTVNDTYNATPAAGGAYPDVTRTGQPLVQPGSRIRIFSSVSGVPVVLAYVRYNPTAHVALTTSNCPGLCYWKSTDGYTVTGTYSENAFAGVLGAEAGIFLNPGVTDGNWTWIQTGGLIANVNCPASTAVGDGLKGGSGTAFVLTRVAASSLATAWVSGIIAMAYTALSSSQATVMVSPLGI